MRGALPREVQNEAAVAERARHLVYGWHAVNAALERAPERLLEIWLVQSRDDARAQGLKDRANIAGVHVHAVTADALAKLVGDVAHQGTAAAMRPMKPWDEHDLAETLSQSGKDPLLLVLDGVTDPHNLGACLRTADAVGVHAVVIPKDRAAAVDGVVRKVAAGAAEFVPVATVTNLARTLSMLKERGIWVVGTDSEAQQTPVRGGPQTAAGHGARGGGQRYAPPNPRAAATFWCAYRWPGTCNRSMYR